MRKEICVIRGPCDETHSDEKASLLGNFKDLSAFYNAFTGKKIRTQNEKI